MFIDNNVIKKEDIHEHAGGMVKTLKKYFTMLLCPNN
jgi:hypothetical protein